MYNVWFRPANILLAQNIDMNKWSVLACDQHTSEPDYWQNVEKLVDGSPSTLRLTLPEVYLDSEDVEKRIEEINRTMIKYLKNGLFRELENSYIYVERTLGNGAVRRGIVGAVDLEGYDYGKGSQSPIRATEGTVLERIPPRVRIRRNAALELPHVMLLVDDDKKTVIEPLCEQKRNFEKCYDFNLMQGGGSVKGYVLSAEAGARMEGALSALSCKEYFDEKYSVKDKGILLFAVGDGNHSLAAAKEFYEQLKKQYGATKMQSHPARYALVEIVNLHDDALQFEPIHRVVFGVDSGDLLKKFSEFYDVTDVPCSGQPFSYVTKEGRGTIYVKDPRSNLPAGTLQVFIDGYISRYGGRVDYIHGEDTVLSLGAQQGNIGFMLPKMEKSELFKTVILDGALPRKTFSMGHAEDKRYYLECRKLKP